MSTAVLEVLKMGLWHKVMSQSLRYIYLLANYVSPPHRVLAGSSPLRTGPKAVEQDMYPLDVILNEQKPFHPTNIFSHSALGHTRSFSTSAVDKARRFPERNKAGEKRIKVDRPKATSTRVRSVERTRPQGKTHKPYVRSRLSKKREPSSDKPSTDHQNFSEVTSEMAASKSAPSLHKPQDQIMTKRIVPDGKAINCSKSAPPIHRKFTAPENVEITKKISHSFGVKAQQIKGRLWETWIMRDSFQNRLCEMQLYRLMTSSDIKHAEITCF